MLIDMPDVLYLSAQKNNFNQMYINRVGIAILDLRLVVFAHAIMV